MAEQRAVLRVAGPDVDQERITVTGSGLQVGRGSRNDLVINQAQISKQHARFFWQNGGLYVEDLDSTNGTFLNDRRLPAKTPEALNIGDVVRMGAYFLILEDVPLRSGPAAPQPYLEVVEAVLEAVLQQPRPSEVPELERSSALLPLPDDDSYPLGIPRERSNWLQYLPAIYSDPEFLSGPDGTYTDFIGRYLLIFESIMTPIIWTIDNFDQYLTPSMAPQEWLEWIAGWFDIILLPQLPIERQRAIIENIGWLFFRRGTRVGMERMLQLVFDVQPEIIEDVDMSHFVVRLPLRPVGQTFPDEVIARLIESQKPAFATFTLEIR